MGKRDDILKDIQNELKDEPAKAETPDFVEIDGVKYFRDKAQASDPNRKVTKLWTNPRFPNREPEMRELEQVAINVAPYADRITLDSVIYLAGRVYEVPVEVAATIREICARTWAHESSTGGAHSHGTNKSVRGSSSQIGAMAPGIAFG